MKTLSFFIVIAISCFSNGQASLNDIARALNTGDAGALGSHFDQTVEIAVMEKEDVYGKEQAISMIARFFEQKSPQSFTQVHNGTSKGNDSRYAIGNLVTKSGAYRVYIYMKMVDGQYLIQELRFDEE